MQIHVNIFCVQRKKETHTGLEKLEGEWIMMLLFHQMIEKVLFFYKKKYVLVYVLIYIYIYIYIYGWVILYTVYTLYYTYIYNLYSLSLSLLFKNV